MTEDTNNDEFAIVDRNDETIAVTSVSALDEEFGPDETFADKVTELSDHDLHIAVEELTRRAFRAAQRHLELLDEGANVPLYITMAVECRRDEVEPIKYRFQCYNYAGPDASAETFDLVLSADTAAKRYTENKRNQPRKLLTAY